MMFLFRYMKILLSADSWSEENGIGTTFSAIRILKDKFIFAHVGDSLIYHNRGSGFQKSQCHTLGDELIEKHGPEAADDMPEHYCIP